MADEFGNHATTWEPTAADVPSDAPGLADLEAIGKVEALRPTQSDMKEAFGEPVDEGKSVRWSLDMKDPAVRGRYKELTQAHRRATITRSAEWNSRKKVEVRNRVTGETRLVFEEYEDTIGRASGMIRSGYGKGARVERGPDGMLFRWVAGWMPTGRTCLGVPLSGDGIAKGIQRDPDGVAWLCNDEGEWELVGEFYLRKAN